MSLPSVRPLAALSSYAGLVELLERRTQGDQWLFEARGAAHQLAFEIEKAGYVLLSPVCLAIRDLFGHLLRHGLQEGDEILPAVERLLSFVGKRLEEPNMRTGERGELQLGSSTGGAALPPLSSTDAGSSSNGLRLPAPAASGGSPDLVRLDGREAWRMVNETRLGEILVREGRIDGKTLDQALVLQQVGCKRLGEVLLGMGKLTPELLAAALNYQRELTLKLADGMTLEGGLRILRAEPASDGQF